MGILPTTRNGAVVVRDEEGNCTNPPNVSNAYCPPSTFETTCPVTALPDDCVSRVSPSQINALVSELMCFAAAMTPDGTWDCDSVCNLAAAFTEWSPNVGVTTDGVTIGGDGNPDDPLTIIPFGVVGALCADEAAAAFLAQCLISAQQGNNLTIGSDGKLYIPGGDFPTLQDVEDANIPPDRLVIQTSGYYDPGDCGAARYVRVATEPTHLGKVRSADGAWWELAKGQQIYAEMFGARADYDEDTGTGTLCGARINSALTFSDVVHLCGGNYCEEETVRIRPYKALLCSGAGYGNIVGDDGEFFENKSGAFLIPRGLPRVHTVNSMITECELSGGVLTNPSAAGLYAESSQGRLNQYRLFDLTMQNANGPTAADPRAFSAAIIAERGSRCDGVGVRTTSESGKFILDASENNFGDQCDFGYLGINAFFAELQRGSFTSGFRIAAVAALTDDVTGDNPDYYPQTDRFFVDQCFIEGHAGFAVRGPDEVRVSAVTTNSISVKWFRSHRYAPQGSIRANGVTLTYTGLAHEIGTDSLVFSGLSGDPVALGISVGNGLVRTQDARTYGTGGVSVNNSFIRSITHPSLKPSTDGFFDDAFPMCGRNIELSGVGVRGIHFNNCYIHGREDVSFFANDAGDIYFSNCYHEAKFLADGQIPVGNGSSVSRFIGLGLAAKTARGIPQPTGNCGDVHLGLWSQTENGTDMRPTYRTSSSFGRFGTGSGINDGLFEPSRCSNPVGYAYGNTNFGTALVDRLPIMRDQNHGYVMVGPFNTELHSVDTSYRQAWGAGQWSVTADLPYAFNFFFNTTAIANLKNATTTALAAWRVENTAGNAWFGVDTDGWAALRQNNITRLKFGPNKLNPGTDNAVDLGTAGTLRYRDLFIVNAPTVGSDARHKDWRGGLTDAEIEVAKRLSKIIGVYRWKHAIEEKGDGARLHAGVTVQEVISCFTEHDLDAFDYAVVCYDEWDDKEAEFDDEGNETSPAIAAGDRYSLRPDELWAFVAAGFEARIASLEGKE